jgi:hypothetical protein
VHQEKPYLVVPVVMMVEGVHNGSQGALFHSIAELGKFPESWNGIPVVIFHPEIEGEPVSANSPEIADHGVVGRVYNTNVQGTELRAEAWLDEDKLNAISVETLEAINESQPVEVSLGMFTENEMTEGEYNGEQYKGIAYNHRPDHLALLPGGKGACSLEDGCGIHANSKKGEEDVKTTNQMIEELSLAGYSLHRIGKYAEQGYNELMSMIYDKLRSMDSQNVYHYCEELYDDYLIYSKSGDNDRKMYKQMYKVENGKIEFVGDPVEVHKKVEYVVSSEFVRTKFNSNNVKKETQMAKENKCPKCVAKIDALLGNAELGFVEADREWLNDLSEAALDKIAPKVKEVEKVVEKVVEINKLAPEDQAALAFGKKQLKERREGWIKGILGNAEKDSVTEERLIKMDDDTLEVMFNAIPKKEFVDYSMNGGTPPVTHKSESGGPLYPAGIEIEKK